MKDSEVIELDSKVFPTSQPPPSYPVQAETDTPKSENPARMVAIPVEDFKQHCIDYHKSGDAGFEEEYESLAVGPLAVHQVSQMLCNKQKNRFANIYPYDDSRVVLEEIPGVLGSDYINASWINGYKHPNAYIASQGPKMSTVGDFWRMVWQYKVDHIVMVTGLCEGGRTKCERYWSEEVGGTVEVEEANLKATTTSITTHRDFVVRTMTLKKTTQSDEQPLAVTQHHFTSWPDHGVPRFATSFISFLRRVQKAHNKDSGVPLVVHCSAGVGRTGTFILLDSMLERIKEQNSINVYELLVSLCERRVLMVQTLEQYVFVHDTLCEVIQCGDTEISASRLNAAVEVMAQSLPGETFTGFQQQFQLLEHVSRKPMEQDFVKAHEHPSKNRYPDRLPYVEFMPCLKPIEKEDCYINASFIDGYKHHRAYIATQAPLQSTVGDMWRMMWEVKSNVMVLLCAFAEDGHEACHPFWPNNEGDTAWYGRVTVTLQSEILMGNFVSRTLLLEGDQVVGQEGEGRVVTQFHMTDWPEHSQPVSTASVLELLDVVTNAQMNSGTRPITVLCNDGVGRTGTFICLHSQLERLKTEGVVDFFQAVKSARIHRAGLVQNAEQYAYCHEVLADFVNGYDNYANFKELV
ncbi:Receptor-type tyrosine-protein phosphatase S [Geodia barretti]|nr:Receptor-type tyrosine-protein phosphatase S [Geodia barretti]